MSIKFVGDRGETAAWPLNRPFDGSTRIFEANQDDQFIIVDQDVGNIREIVLQIVADSLTKNSKWYLEHIKLQTCRFLQAGIQIMRV